MVILNLVKHFPNSYTYAQQKEVNSYILNPRGILDAHIQTKTNSKLIWRKDIAIFAGVITVVVLMDSLEFPSVVVGSNHHHGRL